MVTTFLNQLKGSVQEPVKPESIKMLGIATGLSMMRVAKKIIGGWRGAAIFIGAWIGAVVCYRFPCFWMSPIAAGLVMLGAGTLILFLRPSVPRKDLQYFKSHLQEILFPAAVVSWPPLYLLAKLRTVGGAGIFTCMFIAMALALVVYFALLLLDSKGDLNGWLKALWLSPIFVVSSLPYALVIGVLLWLFSLTRFFVPNFATSTAVEILCAGLGVGAAGGAAVGGLGFLGLVLLMLWMLLFSVFFTAAIALFVNAYTKIAYEWI